MMSCANLNILMKLGSHPKLCIPSVDYDGQLLLPLSVSELLCTVKC